jgi:hypothetical protein
VPTYGRPMNPTKHIAFVTALLASAATPALAGGPPTIHVDKPCYVEGQAQRLTGSGYPPNGTVTLDYRESGPNGSNSLGAELDVDGAGNIAGRMTTPDLASSDDTQETVDLTAASGDSPGASVSFKASILDAYVGPWESHKGNPRKRATFYGFGFGAIGGKKLYAHYILRGKLRKTVAIGHVSGACGDVKKAMRQFPFRPVPAGSYNIKLDATRKWPNKSQGFTYRRVKVSKKRAVR